MRFTSGDGYGINTRFKTKYDNDYEIDSGIITVRWINKKGVVFLIKMDEDDEYLLKQGIVRVDNGGYVMFKVKTVPKQKVQKLSRVVMNAPDGLLVDHIHHDKLDNRKTQLRIVTNAENSQNKIGAMPHSKSGIRGVCWNKQQQKWTGAVSILGKQHHMGYFLTAAEAEKACISFRAKHMPFSQDAITQRRSKRTTK